MIKIIAALCSLSSPANCHEQTVTTLDFADLSMQSCLMDALQLAEWMKQHPAERLAAWRCVIHPQRGDDLDLEPLAFRTRDLLVRQRTQTINL